MNFQTFHAAFVQYLNDNWTETPIIESVNKPEEAGVYDPFITYSTDVNRTETNTISGLGGGGIRSKFRDVIMLITVYVPSASGESLAIDLSQKVEDLFNNLQLVPGSFALDAQTMAKEKSEGMWYGTEVGIYFENREFNI